MVSFSKDTKTFWRRGEPMVWFSGAMLATILLITLTLIFVVIKNGMGVFWPHTLHEVVLQDDSVYMGERVQEEKIPNTDKLRFQMKIGNRDLYGLDFKWFDHSDVKTTRQPENAIVLERMEYGNFYGYLDGVEAPGLTPTDSPVTDYHQAVKLMQPLVEKNKQIIQRIIKINHTVRSLENKQKKLLYQGKSESYDGYQNAEKKLGTLKTKFEEEVASQEEVLKEMEAYRLSLKDAEGRSTSMHLSEAVRLYQPNDMNLVQKLGHYSAKIWELLSDEPRESNTEGGLWPALFGTAILVFIMSFLSFPFGVIAGVYLREYAKDGPMVRAVRIAVNNLAGIPSIVYGVFGLGFFVYGVGGAIDQLFFPERLPTPTFGTGGILWASLTLGLLTIPVVIVSTEEAFGAIPRGVREASLALGSTKFQTLYKVLLPMASPGIMTGFILAMARAAGEVAPLMITGVVKLAPALPVDEFAPFFHLERKFMHLGFHIYDIGFQSPNVEAAKPMVFVTTFLLVVLVLVMTSTAIALRNYMKKKYTMGTF